MQQLGKGVCLCLYLLVASAVVTDGLSRGYFACSALRRRKLLDYQPLCLPRRNGVVVVWNVLDHSARPTRSSAHYARLQAEGGKAIILKVGWDLSVVCVRRIKFYTMRFQVGVCTGMPPHLFLLLICSPSGRDPITRTWQCTGYTR